jgi:opacity protein-like surface antigen
MGRDMLNADCPKRDATGLRGASMKKLFTSVSLIALSAGGSALAADMPVKARSAPPPAVYSWTGCYGGGFVGYGWGQQPASFLGP